MRPRQRKDGGFALVLVLWVLMLAGGIAASQTQTARRAVLTAHSLKELASAQAAADAGVEIAIAGLKGSKTASLRQFHCRLDDVLLHVTIVDEQGKIDLNEASPTAITALLTLLGEPQAEAAALAASIVDYRDPDDLRLPGGAEAGDYARSGLRVRPRNESLGSLYELVNVMGAQDLNIASLARVATVHSGRATVDVMLAPEPVKEVVRTLVAEDRAYKPSTATRFRILAEAETASGARFRREAYIRLNRQPGGGAAIKEWRSLPDTGAAAAPGQSRPC